MPVQDLLAALLLLAQLNISCTLLQHQGWAYMSRADTKAILHACHLPNKVQCRGMLLID